MNNTLKRMAVKSNMEGLVAVSDAIVAMGLTDGQYTFGVQTIEVKGPRAVIAGTDTLCGASVTLYGAVKNLIELAQCTIVEALEAATLHPAQALKLQDQKGKDQLHPIYVTSLGLSILKYVDSDKNCIKNSFLSIFYARANIQ